MSKAITINNYQQLLEFFEESNLSSKEIAKIILQALKVIVMDDDRPRDEVIQSFREFVEKYGNRPGEKPLFLDCPPLDVEK